MKLLHVPWILICSCILLLSLEGFRFPDSPFSPTVYGIDTIVSVQDLGIREDYPTSFSFELRKGDEVKIQCEGCESMLNSKFLVMELQSTADPSKNRLIRQFELDEGLQINLTDTYSLLISTRRKFFRLDELILTAEGISATERPNQWVDANNIYIGKEEGGKNQSIPRFELFLNKGDSLHFLFTPVSESTPDVLTVEVERVGLSGETLEDIGADGILSRTKAPFSGNYAFSIRAEKQGLRDGVFNKREDFYNIQAVRIPKPDPVVISNQSSGGSGGAEEIVAEEETSTEDAITALIESLMPAETPGLIPLPSFKIKESIPPSMQLNSSSRRCTPLPIASDADVMVYWLGTGAGAEREFNQIERERQRTLRSYNAKLPNELLGMYAYSILIKNNPDKFLFQTPRADSIFQEYIEFVIVDDAGKTAFEEGRNPPAKIDSRLTRKNYYNFKGNVAAEPLFLCLCNHNRFTPVDVTFIYSLYNQEKIGAAAGETP